MTGSKIFFEKHWKINTISSTNKVCASQFYNTKILFSFLSLQMNFKGAVLMQFQMKVVLAFATLVLNDLIMD